MNQTQERLFLQALAPLCQILEQSDTEPQDIMDGVERELKAGFASLGETDEAKAAKAKLQSFEARKDRSVSLLSEAEQRQRDAKANHVAALAGNSDEAVESARKVALTQGNDCAILKTEIQTLDQLIQEARDTVDRLVGGGISALHAATVEANRLRRDAAYDTLLSSIRTPEINGALVEYFTASRILDAARCQPNRFRDEWFFQLNPHIPRAEHPGHTS